MGWVMGQEAGGGSTWRIQSGRICSVSSSHPMLCPGTSVSTTSCCCLASPAAAAMERAAQPWVMTHTPDAIEPSCMMTEPLGKNWRLWRTTGHMLLSYTVHSRAAKGGRSLTCSVSATRVQQQGNSSAAAAQQQCKLLLEVTSTCPSRSARSLPQTRGMMR